MAHAEVQESVEQYIKMWKVLAGDTPGADLVDRDGLHYCWAGNAFPFWNALYIANYINDPIVLGERLRDARTYMKSRSQDGLLYLCADYVAENVRASLDALTSDEGLEFALDLFGMVGDLPPVPAMTAPPQLQFRRVDTDEALAAYADINSLGYGLPLEAGRDGLVGSKLWMERAYAYIGYHDGRPVSTSASFVNEGHLYVALVATHPDFQRRGFGEFTVRKALEEGHAATGLQRTTLHATQAGVPVYERIGYRHVTRFLAYRLRK